MNKILEECKKYDLIGIGELTHGELTSWKYRYYLTIFKWICGKQKKYSSWNIYFVYFLRYIPGT